jgi:hypothetical protein
MGLLLSDVRTLGNGWTKRMNRNANGVPCCPKCKSTHNHMVKEFSRDFNNSRRVLMVRLCVPCGESFDCIFEMPKKSEEKPN